MADLKHIQPGDYVETLTCGRFREAIVDSVELHEGVIRAHAVSNRDDSFWAESSQIAYHESRD